MQAAFPARSRFLAATLSLTLVFSSVVPPRGAWAGVEIYGQSVDPHLLRTEQELRTYFEGCNNSIEKTLEAEGLKKDAGDRPTPLMMLGMGAETEASGDVLLSKQQLREIDADSEVLKFLQYLYVASMANTVAAYVRIQTQFQGRKLTAQAVTDKLCSQGAGCPSKALESVKKFAETSIESADTLPRYTPASIANEINSEIRRANQELEKLEFDLDEKPTENKLAPYTRAFISAAVKEGPMRLLAIPHLSKKIGTLQTPLAFRQDLITEAPDAMTAVLTAEFYSPVPIAYKFRPHGFVEPADIAKALPDGVEALEKLAGMLNDAVSLPRTAKSAYQKYSVTRLIGTNALAAHAVLLKHPELAPSACRAFRDFAIERADAHRDRRYVDNAVLWLGFAVALSLALTPVVAWAVIGPMYGAATAATFSATAYVSIFGVSALASIPMAVNSWDRYRKADFKLWNNVAEVLSENEAPEVIVTRIPEQMQRRNAALRGAFMQTGSALTTTVMVAKEIWIAKEILFELKSAPAAAAATRDLKLTEIKAVGKTLVSAAKLSPMAMNAISYMDFKNFVDTVITFEESPGSGIRVRAKVDTYDSARGYVKLLVVERVGPAGPLKIEQRDIRIAIDDYREIIRGFKIKNGG